MKTIEEVKSAVRNVPDFPQKGIQFKDITPILQNPELFSSTIDYMVGLKKFLKEPTVDVIAGIDARGFIFGAAIANKLGVSFVPIRKKGKLPWDTYEESYDLEYGSNTIEIHKDAFVNNKKVLLVDDLLATGGTAAAAVNLVRKAGGEVVESVFMIELEFLNGRSKMDCEVRSLITY